jgi:hypothetical protein
MAFKISQHNKEGRVMDTMDLFSASMANFQQSMALASPFTLFGMTALIYDRFFRGYITTAEFGILFISAFVVYQILHYKYIYPALVRFGSKQSWKHKNPMKEDIVQLEEHLCRIEDYLREQKT